jgi:hypothetical protein
VNESYSLYSWGESGLEMMSMKHVYYQDYYSWIQAMRHIEGSVKASVFLECPLVLLARSVEQV